MVVSVAIIIAAALFTFAIVAAAYLSAEADKHEADSEVEKEKLRLEAQSNQLKVSADLQKKAVEEYNKELKDENINTFLQAVANIDKIWEASENETRRDN